MAIRIEAQLSKKIPIPGNEYSSQQASISISSEVSNPNEVVAESLRLYALAEQAVNTQLKLHAPTQANSPQPSQAHRPTQASAPYQRRGPSPVTDSQLKYLNRLIQQNGSSIDGILRDHQITDLRELSAKDAFNLIDRMKA